MQAFSSFLIKLNHPLVIFSILGLRAGILGASIGDAAFLIGYLSYLAYDKYLANLRKNDVNEQMKSEIGELKTMVSTMGLKAGVKPIENPTSKRYF